MTRLDTRSTDDLSARETPSRRRSPLRWVLTATTAAVALAAAGPYLYIHLVEGAAPAALSAGAAEPVQPAQGPVAGRWEVVGGSQAGYRVGEVLGGQRTTAVGRTSAVSGRLTATDTQVTAAAFTVDLSQVSSDQARRDAQFRGRIMQTDRFPTADFTLADPVDLGPLAAAAGTQVVQVRGRLGLHGTTRDVTVPLTVVRSGGEVRISGQVPVSFADYGIDNPSVGGFVRTDDGGAIEVLLTLSRSR